MVRHNNVVPNAHFRKDWQRLVKTWLNQPARKERRRLQRAVKAKQVAPRPVSGALRPIVRCPTKKYNMKSRAGRGFTLAEIKEAGFTKLVAQSLGIAVDHRRKNRSEEGFQKNVQRLKEYRAKLIVFPRRAGKVKSGDSEDVSGAEQNEFPVPREKAERIRARVITAAEKKRNVRKTLAMAVSNARLVGLREKSKQRKEEEAKNAALRKK